MTAVVEPLLAAGPPGPDLSRRRAWLLTTVVALLVLVYLVGWSLYAGTHTADRYRQLPPGAVGTRAGAEVRLLSLTRTQRLAAADGGDPQIADAGTTFVVAELELTQRRSVDIVVCTADLLGADQRLWEPEVLGVRVQRPESTCRSDAAALDQPRRFDEIYVVPTAFVDGLVGVALTDHSNADRTQVLRPPA